MLAQVSNTSLMFNTSHGEAKNVADGLNKNLQDFHKMEFHDYVNKAIASVRPKDIMVYARGNNHG